MSRILPQQPLENFQISKMLPENEEVWVNMLNRSARRYYPAWKSSVST